MALTPPKTTLFHAVLATISHEVATVDEIIFSPSRLPPELLLIIRAHLLTAVATQLFLNSTRALAKYEADLLALLCPDCISYNYDIYGPDIWQWQQFSGPCTCVQTTPSDSPSPTRNPQQFTDPHHWLEYHLSLQVARLSATSPTHPLSIWDVVADVLDRRCRCEILREDLSDSVMVQGGGFPPGSVDAFYHRRVVDYYGPFRQPRSPPVVHILPLPSALRLYESQGIGEAGAAGDAFRAEVIFRQLTQELGLALELKDVFSLPREPPPPLFSSPPCRQEASDIPMLSSTALLLHPYSSPVLQGAIKTYSFISAVLGVFVSMPMTVATIALTVICFYSRPVALRVGA